MLVKNRNVPVDSNAAMLDAHEAKFLGGKMLCMRVAS